MELLNHEFQIYSANISELTFGAIRRGFKNFTDNESVGCVSAWYEHTTDKLILNKDYVIRNKGLYEFCEKCFMQPLEELRTLNITGIGRKEIVEMIANIRIKREQKAISEREATSNLGAKFIGIGDDVFQISKIVSVKCRDENLKFFVEVYVTNKQASIKKIFPSKVLRDQEFLKVKKALVQFTG